MKVKKLVALGLAAVMTLSLAACGGGSSDSSSSSSDSASSEGGGELNVWLEKIFTDDANNAMEERINSFAERGIYLCYRFHNEIERCG